jgi:hypothetical protein
VSAPTTFYWDGEDHEDLYCVCGTPFPEQIFEEAFPARAIVRCTQCGATADLDEGTGDWVVRRKPEAAAV